MDWDALDREAAQQDAEDGPAEGDEVRGYCGGGTGTMHACSDGVHVYPFACAQRRLSLYMRPWLPAWGLPPAAQQLPHAILEHSIPTRIKHLRQGVMKFFKELYANGDEDFRRAMVKSSVNSGARALRSGRDWKLCDCFRLRAL